MPLKKPLIFQELTLIRGDRDPGGDGACPSIHSPKGKILTPRSRGNSFRGWVWGSASPSQHYIRQENEFAISWSPHFLCFSPVVFASFILQKQFFQVLICSQKCPWICEPLLELFKLNMFECKLIPLENLPSSFFSSFSSSCGRHFEEWKICWTFKNAEGRIWSRPQSHQEIWFVSLL